MIATQLASTVATSSKNPDLELTIPGYVRMDVYSDFTITFEVYCLRAHEEVLPHKVKYHINKKGTCKLTPKKAKQDSRLYRPPKESPAGPTAVRSPTFALMGYVVFSIQALNRNHWTLNKVCLLIFFLLSTRKYFRDWSNLSSSIEELEFKDNLLE